MMAGAWIKWEKGLAEKPEVIAMAAALQMDRRDIAGRLMYVWEWADAVTRTGNGVRVTPAFIDERAGIQNFADTMQSIGWLVIEKGHVSFPNFGRHNSQTAKDRALTARRVAKHRGDKANANITRAPLPEKRREEKIYNPPLPPILDTEKFRKTWQEWCDYRRQIRKKLTASTVSRQLKRLEAMGHDAAIIALETAIEKGWVGFHEADADQRRQAARGGYVPPEEADERI